jgi:hypothetical protein
VKGHNNFFFLRSTSTLYNDIVRSFRQLIIGRIFLKFLKFNLIYDTIRFHNIFFIQRHIIIILESVSINSDTGFDWLILKFQTCENLTISFISV